MKTIVRMKGGLGNQLFQYAAGLYFSGLDPNKIFMDLSYYEKDSRHGGFLLDRLFLPEFMNLVGKNELISAPVLNLDSFPTAFVDKKSVHKDLIVLSGYFQNLNYVSQSIDLIRKLLLPSAYSQALNSVMSNNLFLGNKTSEGQVTIGVHLRRGDYSDPETLKVHGTVKISSISKLLSDLKAHYHQKNITTKVIVFSDSKDNFKFCANSLYFPASSTDKFIGLYEEFVAIGQCDYVVCSNSSFSLWASMLFNHSKQVFLPSKWMKTGDINPIMFLESSLFKLYNADLD
jgi:hypothetical protein